MAILDDDDKLEDGEEVLSLQIPSGHVIVSAAQAGDGLAQGGHYAPGARTDPPYLRI